MSNNPILLYIDDESLNLMVVKALLRNEYKIFTANSHSDGLDILERNNIDVVISDQKMPDMIGTDLLRIVRVKYPSKKTVILSGYISDKIINIAVEQGVVDLYLTKPLKREFLINFLEKEC